MFVYVFNVFLNLKNIVQQLVELGFAGVYLV